MRDPRATHVVVTEWVAPERAAKELASPQTLLDPLLTVEDVAALLRLSPKSIYKLVEEGRLPGVRRIGRRVRFYRPELVAWIAGQESARPRRSR